jgi:hypothetical protein
MRDVLFASQVEEPLPPDGWEVHTVKDSEMAAAVEWLAASLATAEPGVTVYTLHPGSLAGAAFQQLCRLLEAGGCACSLATSEVWVFDYIGYVGGCHTLLYLQHCC